MKNIHVSAINTAAAYSIYADAHVVVILSN